MTNNSRDDSHLNAVAFCLLFYSMIVTILLTTTGLAYHATRQELQTARKIAAEEDAGWKRFAEDSSKRLRDANDRARYWQDRAQGRPTIGMPPPIGEAPPK